MAREITAIGGPLDGQMVVAEGDVLRRCARGAPNFDRETPVAENAPEQMVTYVRRSFRLMGFFESFWVLEGLTDAEAIHRLSGSAESLPSNDAVARRA